MHATRPPGFPFRTAGPFAYYAPEFEQVVGTDPCLELAIETDAHEGPVYVEAGNQLLFTSVRTDTVGIRAYLIDEGRVETLREPSNLANGMTRGLAGELLVCEQGTRTMAARISRLRPPFTGEPESVIDSWFGLPFNSPNDIVVKSDGSIWFTDPDYGHNQGFKPAPQVGSFVYRYEPTSGRIDVVVDSCDKPNGLAFSPDESLLYVTDTAYLQGLPEDPFPSKPHHVLAFDVTPQGKLSGGRLFVVTDQGIPDGIKVDRAGRVYLGCADGVQVIDPHGRLIGKILVQGGVPNFTFGGPQRDVLFLMNDHAIWTVRLQATGAGR